LACAARELTDCEIGGANVTTCHNEEVARREPIASGKPERALQHKLSVALTFDRAFCPRKAGSAAALNIFRKRHDLASSWLLLFQRLETFLQEHIKVPRLPELFGEPFQFILDVSRIRLLDKLLEQRHGRAKPPEAHPHLVHTFRIAMGHGIPVCGKVVQAGKADDLKGLTCSHCRAQGDLVPKDRSVIFTTPNPETPPALGFRPLLSPRSISVP